ncbi:MAG: porin [Candidatus Omnitrophica bacterium]|nr:porin [Candidatus Omnitrophota bacterium]
MRLFTVLCVAALVVAFAVPAFAETQNIKVSGDIKAAYVYQKNLDYTDNDKNNQNFFVQQVGLNVEADLTDNVSTYVRLINERDWDGINSSSTNFDIMLDEAYVTLKEMLYAPLTVKLGRQNIWLGKGFVIGNAGVSQWALGSLPSTVRELSDLTAFDAVRATLDYDPWTVDLIYSKIIEDDVASYEDRNLYVANVGYDFTKYDAEAEAYYIYVHDKQNRTITGKTNNLHTIGLRGSLVPFDNMNLWAEGAYQCGEYRTSSVNETRKAGAVDAGIDYTFADVKWTPKVGAEWTWLSGDKEGTNKYEAWDPLFRGKFDSYISDFRNITKLATQGGSIAAANDYGMTNQQSIALFGSIAPMTDITMDARWTYLWHDQKLTSSGDESKRLGHEIDGKVAYDYTEDVEFNVMGGVFWPGKYYKSPDNKAASQIIAGVSVDF